MAWVTEQKTYDRKVKDPSSGEEATVTFRPLNAGDEADIDESALEITADGIARMRSGLQKFLTLERAVVAWTIPGVEPTAHGIRHLQSAVVDELMQHVSFGVVPEEPAEDPLAGTANGATSKSEKQLAAVS
jgi:hypothetical protein